METEELHYKLNLQLFAKDGPGGEKTEPASGKKLNDARKEGQTAKSKELINSVSLFAMFLALKVYISSLGTGFMEYFEEVYGSFSLITKDFILSEKLNLVMAALGNAFKKIMLSSIPFMLVAMIVGFIMNIVQQKWMITSKPLQPKLSKLSPLSGFKRIFSTKQLVELLKNIAMVAIIALIVYNTLKDKYTLLYMFYRMSLSEAIYVIGDIIISTGMKISAFFLIVGFVDLVYQRYKFKEDMKMTKQEVKDEFKNTEGDPTIKGQIRRKMQEASRRRMMQSLPEADVVITNPTHFAVALKYDADSGRAPYVIAKGADYLAFQIKDKARAYDIEIVENKPLARLLYHNVEVGDEIPQELYQAVAEVLAAVYRIKNKL